MSVSLFSSFSPLAGENHLLAPFSRGFRETEIHDSNTSSTGVSNRHVYRHGTASFYHSSSSLRALELLILYGKVLHPYTSSIIGN